MKNSMRFYEYEAKTLFEMRRLPLGPRHVVHSAQEAAEAARQRRRLPLLLDRHDGVLRAAWHAYGGASRH